MTSAEALELVARANALVESDAANDELKATVAELTDVLNQAVQAITVLQQAIAFDDALMGLMGAMAAPPEDDESITTTGTTLPDLD